MKARTLEGGGWIFWCPGCDGAHAIDTRWTFNGDKDRPTFRASVLVYEHRNDSGYYQPRCHSFVTDGRIEFLGDSTHALSGKTVDLPEWPKSNWGGLSDG